MLHILGNNIQLFCFYQKRLTSLAHLRSRTSSLASSSNSKVSAFMFQDFAFCFVSENILFSVFIFFFSYSLFLLKLSFLLLLCFFIISSVCQSVFMSACLYLSVWHWFFLSVCLNIFLSFGLSYVSLLLIHNSPAHFCFAVTYFSNCALS